MELVLGRLPALGADAHDAEVAQVHAEAARRLQVRDQIGDILGTDLPGAMTDGAMEVPVLPCRPNVLEFQTLGFPGNPTTEGAASF